MKFVSKILAASIAALAIAGTAHAAGTTGPASGTGSSVLLYVWDTNVPAGSSVGEGYVLDTGLTYAQLETLSGTDTVNLGGSSLFQSLFSSTDISAGDVDFMLVSGNEQTTVPNAITSGPVGTPPAWKSGSTVVGNILAYSDNALVNLSGSPESAISGAVYGNGNFDLSLNANNTQNNSSQDSVLLGGGTTAELYSATAVANTGTPKAPVLHPPTVVDTGDTITLLADGQVAISGGVLATPLPAAVWLFGSGLLGFFGVGRRRRNAA